MIDKSEKFNILFYEFSKPMVLAINKFQLLFTPAYIVPQNILTVKGRPDLSQHGEKMLAAKIVF